MKLERYCSYGSFTSENDKESALENMSVNPNELDINHINTAMVVRPMVHTPTVTRVFSRVQPGSLRGSIFTLASSAIGAGLLSLPFVLKQTGLAFGVLICAAGAFLALLSLNLLLESADVIFRGRGMTGGRCITYSQLVTEILGERSGIFLEAVLVVYSFGTVVGYFLVISASVNSVCRSFHVSFPSENFPVYVASLMVLPLAMFRDISSLAYSSLFGVFTMVAVCFVIAYKGYEQGSIEGVPVLVAQFDHGVCSAISLVFFAYNCHVNVFAIYSSLRFPMLSRMQKVTRRSVVLQLILYTGVAISGYAIFKDQTKGNILDNFPPSDWMIMLCKAGVSLTLVFNTPLCIHPARENYFLLVNKIMTANCGGSAPTTPRQKSPRTTPHKDIKSALKDTPPPLGHRGGGQLSRTDSFTLSRKSTFTMQKIPEASLISHVLVTLIMIAGSAYLAINVPGVSIVFSFLGATACILTSYFYPILMFTTVIDKVPWIFTENSRSTYKYSLWALLSVICVIGVVSVYDTAQTVMRGEAV
mmetsp:Transcript_29763/g.72516  ORF Transcript_29763/g.72516 Transcript_29763/m.72516 type:complete len:531 (+) Transcript_29763:56-1648(+)